MKSVFLSLCACVCVLHTPVHSMPRPQLSEAEFNARARSLDAGFDKNVFMISGYSKVRMQGGRSVQEPIKFPTLTVKSPNQIPVENRNKVRLSLANPVYKEELDSIVQQINEINIEEAERIDQETLEKLEAELAADQEKLTADQETELAADQETDADTAVESSTNELEIVEVTTKMTEVADMEEAILEADLDLEAELKAILEDKLEANSGGQAGDEEVVSEEPLPTTQTLEILEVTNMDKMETPFEDEEVESSTLEDNIITGDDNKQTLNIIEIEGSGLEPVLMVDSSALEPVLMEEMSLDIELDDEIEIAPLQTEQLLIEEVTTSTIPTLEIKEV